MLRIRAPSAVEMSLLTGLSSPLVLLDERKLWFDVKEAMFSVSLVFGLPEGEGQIKVKHLIEETSMGNQ